MTRAAAAAYKALELDPELADAHASMGMARTLYYWDWIGAEQAFKKALALDARSPIAHMYYSLLLSALGRHDESLAQARRGRDLDPLSLLMQIGVGWSAYFARRYDEAAEAFRAVTLIEPDYPGSAADARVRARAHRRLPPRVRHPRAGQSHLRRARRPGDGGGPQGGLRSGRARRLLARAAGRLRPHGPRRYRSCRSTRACAPTRSSANPTARSPCSTRFIAARSGQAVFTAVDPVLDPLRDDPRFARALQRLALPAPATTP